ncbi:MGMT family protein [Nonlabens sp.]|uniref:MGMT family protein n=1 Tax=Nonlabens sp. TaxID=1888209 RepID=UPI0025E887D2|nr:MGMT family protein [Nonlabens sp.]
MSSDDFFGRVYEVVKQIPYGKVTSYGAIARVLGTPRSSRAVGYAMNASHNDPEVPAHRVVNRNGILTGKHHFPGTNLMRQLLESEGLIIEEDQIKNFKENFWDPMTLLNMQNKRGY